MADFNGDGKPDLVVANLNSDNVSVLLNTTPSSDLSISRSGPAKAPAGQPFEGVCGRGMSSVGWRRGQV